MTRTPSRSISTVARSIVLTAGVGVLKRAAWLRGPYRRLRDAWRALGYRRLWTSPVDPHLIVLETFNGRAYAGSPRALYEAMLDDPRFAEHRFVWSFLDPADHQDDLPSRAPRTTLVRTGSAQAERAFAVAGTWVSSSILPQHLVPRAGQRYVQTWHGTPLKRIGLDVVDDTATAMNGKSEIEHRYRDEGRKVTWFLSSSPFTTRCFASAFDLPTGPGSPLVETGMPRNDALAAATPEDVAAARERLGLPSGARVILYAPTWRDDQHQARDGYVYRNPLDLRALMADLGPETVLLFRAHYLVARTLDLDAFGDRVRDVSGVDEINEIFLAADVLVTDYSSAYFDYALLGRPMIFFMYDLEHYRTRLRGFYLPIESVPGPIVTTQEELTAELTAVADTSLPEDHAEASDRLNAQFNPHDDGEASRRVLDLLTD